MMYGTIRLMRSMTRYEQGDVVIVSFPFTDTYSHKKRPAVIISRSVFNARTEDVVIAAITSNPQCLAGKESADQFRIVDQEVENAGLLCDSTVKIGKMVTIEKKLIMQKRGALSPAATRALAVKIKAFF